MAERSIITYSNIIGDDGTFDDIFKNLDKLESRLSKLAKKYQGELKVVSPNDSESVDLLTKKTNQLERALENINKQRKETQKQRKKLIELTQEELIQREAEKIANRERVQRAKQLAIIRREEKNTIASLRAQLSLTTLDWKKLTSEEAKNSKEGKDLVANKKRLTEQLKALEKQTGDNRRNVGNYTSALGKLGRTSARVFLGRSLVDGLRRISSFFTEIIDKNKEFDEELNGLSDSFDGVGDALNFAGTQILKVFAPAIKFVADLLASLPAVFGGIVEASKQFATNAGNRLRSFGLRAQIVFENIQKVNPFSDRSREEINANIRSIERELQNLTTNQRSIQQAFRDGYNDTVLAQEEFTKNQKEQEENAKRLKEAEAKRTKELEKQKKLTLELVSLDDARLKAIIKLQDEITKAEVGNIEDRKERLLALEDLAFKAQQKIQEDNFNKFVKIVEKQEQILIDLFGENSDRVIAFREKAAKDILEIEAKNQSLSEEQLKASEARKLEIIKARYKNTEEIQALTEEEIKRRRDKEAEEFNKKVGIDTKQLLKNAEELRKAQIEEIQKTAKARKEAQEQLFSDIIDSSKKVADIIGKTFEAQTQAATKSVEKQAEAVENQRERAEAGLENTLKFEQEQLAQRQAEQQRAQKQQEQAAKLLTLFNLVAAYAQSGDENALQRGLVDFALLEAIGSSLQGFYDGTEDTGTVSRPLDSKGGRLAVLHDNERVLTKAHNQALGAMTNEELVNNALLGMHISDNPNLYNGGYYKQQADDFARVVNGSGGFDLEPLREEMRATRKAIEKQPKIDNKLEQTTDVAITISKRVTKGLMTREQKIKKYL